MRASLRTAFAVAILSLLCASAAFANSGRTRISETVADEAWRAELKRQCPSHHVEWLCDECWDALLAGFDRTLPTGTRRKIEKLDDWSHSCRNAMGFSCELIVSVDTYHKLGLTRRFATYGCRHYRCEEMAMCEGPGIGR